MWLVDLIDDLIDYHKLIAVVWKESFCSSNLSKALIFVQASKCNETRCLPSRDLFVRSAGFNRPSSCAKSSNNRLLSLLLHLTYTKCTSTTPTAYLEHDKHQWRWPRHSWIVSSLHGLFISASARMIQKSWRCFLMHQGILWPCSARRCHRIRQSWLGSLFDCCTP